MTRTGKLFLLSCYLLICSISVGAQTTSVFLPTTIEAESNKTFEAEIRISPFSFLVSIQFSLTWDADVIKYVDFQPVGLSLNSDDNFGETQINNGFLFFKWEDETLDGVSLQDSVVIFKARFQATGNVNDTTSLRFVDGPNGTAIRELADTSFQAIPASYSDAFITVTDESTNTTYNSAPELVKLKEAYPNPFTELTRIELELQNATNARIKVHNTHGQTIYEEKKYLLHGSQILTFKKDIFPQSGIYYLQIESPDFLITQKLVMQ